MSYRLISVAAILGFVAVALGAFGAHGLKKIASPEMISIFNLAVEYQFYHTFALFILAMIGKGFSSKLFYSCAGFFIAGILLFSGSLYLYVLTGVKWVGPITPMGGFCFLIGWLLLAIGAWRKAA